MIYLHIVDDMFAKLCSFSFVPSLVQSLVITLGPISARQHTPDLDNWPSTLVTKCDEALSNFMLPQVFEKGENVLSYLIDNLDCVADKRCTKERATKGN